MAEEGVDATIASNFAAQEGEATRIDFGQRSRTREKTGGDFER